MLTVSQMQIRERRARKFLEDMEIEKTEYEKFSNFEFSDRKYFVFMEENDPCVFVRQASFFSKKELNKLLIRKFELNSDEFDTITILDVTKNKIVIPKI